MVEQGPRALEFVNIRRRRHVRFLNEGAPAVEEDLDRELFVERVFQAFGDLACSRRLAYGEDLLPFIEQILRKTRALRLANGGQRENRSLLVAWHRAISLP